MRPSIAIAATSLTAMVLSACPASQPDELSSMFAGDGILAAGGLLAQFQACDPLLDHLKREALERVGPWGLDGGVMVMSGGVAAMEDSVDAASGTAAESAPTGSGTAGVGGADGDAASRAGAAPTPGQDFSGTNTQEVDVDEPDILKTDGELIVTVVEGRLRVVDATGTRPLEVGSLRLPQEWGWGAQLLMVGDRVVAMGSRWGGGGGGGGVPMPLVDGPAMGRPFAPDYGHEVAVAWLIDLSDPSRPAKESELELDGRVLSARQVGDRIHLAVASHPTGLSFTYPDGGLRGEREAEDVNRQVIADSTLDDWLPYMIHTDDRGVVSDGLAVDCAQVAAPVEFGGFGTVALLSLDPERGVLEPTSTAAVLSNGEQVYASTDRFVVATTSWVDPEALDEAQIRELDTDWVTALHTFDISDPAGLHHVASGKVPGTVLNQFSMSEYEGILRVATTRGTPWGNQTDSLVTTLAEGEDGRLQQLGQVAGLGRGERIFAVRFLGDVGYVVTFRQVDPLYALDLSDPTDPSVRGELKIPGYSAYLHPMDADHLIGIGQDATDEGRTLGTQVQLFDVSDLSEPQRIDHVTITDGHSNAEWDHHAFLYWAPTGMTLLPIEVWGDEVVFSDDVVEEVDPETGEVITIRPGGGEVREEVQSFFGAEAFHIDTDGIERVGRVSHEELTSRQDPWRGVIQRSLVLDGRLWTLSQAGLLVSDLDSLDTLATLAW